MKNLADTPIIRAQEICKKTVLNIADVVVPMYESLVEESTLRGYEARMEPFNNGYELAIDPTLDFSKGNEIPFIEGFRFFVRPSTFFSSEYSEDKAAFEIGITFGQKTVYEQQEVRGEIKLDETKILTDMLNLVRS